MYGSRSVPRIPPSLSAPWRCSGSGGAPQAGQTLVQSGRGLPQSGQSESVMMLLSGVPGISAAALAAPARAIAASVDVRERPVAATRLVEPDASHEGRVLGFHALHRASEELRVLQVDPPVAG